MVGFLIRLIVNVAALFLVAWLSGGAVEVRGITGGIMAAAVLGVGNALVKPVLYFIAKKVTCVLSCVTLGLWSLILSWGLSALIFFWAGQFFAEFSVKSYPAALFGSLVLAIVNAIASVLTGKGKD